MGLPWLKTHCVAGRDVEAHAKAGGAIENQGSVHLKKVKMGSHLNGPIPSVGNLQGHGGPSDVGLDGILCQQQFPWD
jgi:hypothetical protein